MSDVPTNPDDATTAAGSPFASNGSGLTHKPTPSLAEHIASKERGHGKKFVLIYGGLGAVAALAVAGFILADSSSSVHASGWSNWRPKAGTNGSIASQIADHVSHEYHLNKKGTQLVAVVAEPPQVTSGTHKIAISNIALPGSAKSKAIDVINTGGTWVDQYCGLTPSCAIASGKPTVARGRLVRREALEVALYTLKFVPSIKAVVAFMPPPPGATASTLLYLQRANLAKQLSEPLSKTLPLVAPPLPTSTDTKEAATIDKLTLPAVYKYQLQQLQDASALLVLKAIKA